MRIHLRELLETRLRLAQAWSGQSEALEASLIQRPVFITGMPRSGSTFLHELLAEDPENRVPRVWEVMFPVPGQNNWTSEVDPRVRKAEACLWWFRRLAPGADAVYPMRAWTPHECVAIHSYTLLSEEFVSTCRIPTYEAFLRAADLGPRTLAKTFLATSADWADPTRRWVLKSPDHVHGLEESAGGFSRCDDHPDPSQSLRGAEVRKSIDRDVAENVRTSRRSRSNSARAKRECWRSHGVHYPVSRCSSRIGRAVHRRDSTANWCPILWR